jgi:phenylpropionate dioxygenase-like ring-hydroxylating dioxygenase large terminal subunit
MASTGGDEARRRGGRDLFDPTRFAATRRPALEASGLPAFCYTSPAWYAREVERIFLREWIFVGRADQIPHPGDYLAVEIAGEPLVVVRDQQGEIRAFSASCRHRGTRIVSADGHARAFRCPYHAWTYALDGQLIGCAEMQRTRDFDRSRYGLVPIALERWAGFLFVRLSPEGPGLAAFLGDLPERLAGYRLDEMVCTRRVTYDLACNWKVYVENAMEVYHVPFVHGKTIEETVPMSVWTEEEARGSYIILYGAAPGSLALLEGDEGFPPIEGLPEKLAAGSYIPLIYPSTMLGCTIDTMWWLQILPGGPERTWVTVGSCFPRATVARPDFATVAARYYTRWDTTIPEDNAISALQQQGLRARLSRPGRYSYREVLVHDIATYVLDRVLDPA